MVRIHHVLSDDPAWPGERGRVDVPMIRRLVPDFTEREIFLCGPPPMMNALIKALHDEDVSTHHIHYERFAL